MKKGKPVIPSNIRELLTLFDVRLTNSRFWYVLHDRNGVIIRFFSGDHQPFRLISKELEKTGTLAGHYRFPLDSATGECYQARTFTTATQALNFVTSLPQTILRYKQVSPNLFLSRITLMEYLPDMASHTRQAWLLAGMHDDRLLGHTPDFPSKLGLPGKTESLNNRPLAEFLSPSPREYRETHLARFLKTPGTGFEKVFEKDYAAEAPSRFEDIQAIQAQALPGRGLILKAVEAAPCLTFLSAVNSMENDLIMSLEGELVSGQPPALILGVRQSGEELLADDTGYRIGPAYWDSGTWQVKRNGYFAYTEKGEGLPAGKPLRLELRKTGSSVHLQIRSRPVLSFLDPDFMADNAAYLSLGLRPGDAFLLRKVSLKVRRTPPEFEALPRNVVRLSGSNGYYTCDRFYTTRLSQIETAEYAGYVLSNVTDMQGRIEDLGRRYHAQQKREKELRHLLERFKPDAGGFVGSGTLLSRLREKAAAVAASDAPVLVEGPTGSGKELLARFIHDRSPRQDQPFVKVDCATVPQSLIEDHLFGHEKGAFTGAVSAARGMLEAADKGTLFLDEVGNLTPEVQAKLLRFFNDYTFTRIGGTEPVRMNLRCITASNVPLRELVARGQFREDLYYRLNVVLLEVPPLAKRKEDLPALMDHFLKIHAAETKKEIRGFAPEAVRKIESHAWPGNVRELGNVIRRAVIFCNTDRIAGPDIEFPESPAEEKAGRKERPPFYLALTDRNFVLDILKRHHGHATRAAREMGVARGTLYKFLSANKIDIRALRKGFGPG